MQKLVAELVVDAKAQVGEGPVWSATEGRLYWVDIMGARLHRFDPRTGEDTSVDVGQPLGCVRPRTSGGLVAAVRDGFAALDPRSGTLDMIALVEADDPGTRMNDGACDALGRFWAGTMGFNALEAIGAGSLYCLETDHSYRPVLKDLTIPNGIAWSADQSVMYFVDSLSYGIDQFDFDLAAGSLTNRQQVTPVGGGMTVPDGMAIDAEGCLWVAVWNGSAAHRYSPDGELLCVVELPVPNAAGIGFGGDDLGDLYIATARSADNNHELAGGLFRCRPGVHGTPTHAYAG